MKEEDGIQRIEEQIGESNITDYEPIAELLNKFQKQQAKLKKKKKSLITRHITNVSIRCNITTTL